MKEEKEEAVKGQFNFDHPEGINVELMEKCLKDILNGRPTKLPLYDFKSSSQIPGKFTVINPSDVVLVEVSYFKNKSGLFSCPAIKN